MLVKFHGYRIYAKGADQNYESDYNQLVELKLQDIDASYWLASRYYNSYGGGSYPNFNTTYQFSIRYITTSGALGSQAILSEIYGYNNGMYSCGSSIATFGLRPVFTLKPEVKIVYGEGTSDSPYVLEL